MESRTIDREGEEIKSLALSGRWRLFSDDAIFRVYCELPKSLSVGLCSTHLMEIADAHGLMTAEEVGLRIGKLTRWNVGVVVKMRYLVALMRHVIGIVTDFRATRARLDGSTEFRALVDGLWDHKKAASDVVGHFASVTAELANEPGNRPEAIAALWAIWDTKAKLRQDLGKIPRARRMADTMVVIAFKIRRPDKTSISKLWTSYIQVVDAELGPLMDERAEREARREVGAAVARIGQSDMAQSEALLKILGLGLTEGTLEFDLLPNGYAAEKIEIAKKESKKQK